MLAEWCGARNGRRLVSAPPWSTPATEATIETSRSSAGASGGRMEGSREASIDFGAGRPDHEEIMAASGGHFERALGAFLTFDVGEIGRYACGLEDFWLRPRQHLRALEMVGELNQRRSRDDLDVRARPRRFGPAPPIAAIRPSAIGRS
jgi:hypothetical protein